ncbi:MAG: hypothetical protein AAB417_01575 [Patescibacteria group bacterium]
MNQKGSMLLGLLIVIAIVMMIYFMRPGGSAKPHDAENPKTIGDTGSSVPDRALIESGIDAKKKASGVADDLEKKAQESNKYLDENP